MTERSEHRSAPVPSGRLSRLWHLGRTAGGIATAAATRGLVGLARGKQHPFSRSLLTSADAQKLTQSLSRMRGAAMKFGQLLSMDGTDVLPAELAELLAPLRDRAHIMPMSELARVLEQEYGCGWNKRFRRFDFNPMAAASIGQVHRAETRDGRVVAIKVQYPGVRESIDSDIGNLSLLLRLLGPLTEGVDLGPSLEEARVQLHREADYAAEARALSAYGALVADDPALRVPQAYDDLSTTRVLAMEFVEGVPVERAMSGGASRELRERVAEVLSRLVLRELFEFGMMQTDPNYANYLIDERAGCVALLDFGAVRAVEPGLADAYRNLARAAVAENRAGVRDAAIAMGYLDHADSAGHARGLVDLILTASEPLRHRGPYDFGRSGLFARANAMAQALVFRDGFHRTPPPETMFLHRKFVGTFMLCARLRARLDVRGLTEPWLAAP